jgi:integral membrane protein
VAAFAEHVLGWGEPTAVAGPVHGVVFLTWLGAVVAARDELGWTRDDVFAAVLWGLVPFGAYLQLRRSPTTSSTSS